MLVDKNVYSRIDKYGDHVYSTVLKKVRSMSIYGIIIIIKT